jgi:putative oxidoreductase
MKIFTIIIRSLLGLFLMFASLAYFFHFIPEPPQEGDMKTFNEGMVATKYLMPLVKTLELICGLSFLLGRFVSFFNLVLLPISLNIFLINLYLMPKALPAGGFLFFGNLFLIYRHWNSYKNLFLIR